MKNLRQSGQTRTNTGTATGLSRPILLILLSLAVLASCGRTGNTDQADLNRILASGDAAARSEAFRDTQAGLLTGDAEKSASKLIAAAGRPRTVTGGLIRESIDFSASTMRYYSVNSSEILESGSAGNPGSKQLQIVDFGPSGELPAENRRPSIYVMFNQPMVPLAQLGLPITESPILTMDPPVEGIYRWYGTKTLSFRPAHPLREEPRYTVSISRDTASLSGRSLNIPFSFDIFGETVKIVNMFPGNDADAAVSLYDVPTRLAQEVTLEFNQPVDPEHIRSFIKVSQGNRILNFSVTRPDYPERLESRTDRALLLKLNQEPPENSVLKFTLEDGAGAFAGYPVSPRSQSYQMRTIRPFKAEDLSAWPGGFPRDNRPALYPVYLQFSHPLDESRPLDGLTVKVDGRAVVPEDIAVSWSTVAIYLADIRPGMNISVSIPPDLKDVYGRVSQAGTLSTEVPRPDPLVDFPSHYDGLRHLEAEFPPALVWSSRNIVRARMGVEGQAGYYDRSDYHPPMEEVDLSSTKTDITYFHQQDLKPYLNEAGYGTVNFSYSMDKDPAQVDSRRRNVRGDLAVQVTDLGLTVRAGYNRVLVWVNRLSDGTSVEGAEVTVFNLHGTEYRGITDSRGLAAVVLPPGDFARYFYNRDRVRTDSLHVRAGKDGDLAEMRVENNHSPYMFGVYNAISPQHAEKARNRVHMFTDRGLYKSAEELALRGIHWLQTPDGYSSYTGPYDISIVEGATDRVIWKTNGKTSESGGFHHRLRLPDKLEPGGYQIVYRIGDFSTATEFRIASFRRVNFQVTSEVPPVDFFHGDTVEAVVEASNLAGGVLPSADYHYYWSRKPVRYTPPGAPWKDWVFGTDTWAPEQTLTSGDGVLSGAGSARISEGTINHEVTGKAYRYTLETTVEDIDRQVVSSVASAIVHPSTRYIAARFKSGSVDGWWSRFVSTGKELIVQARLTDIHGEVPETAGVLKTGLVKKEWKSASQQGLYGRVNTRWEFVEEELWQEEKALLKSGLDMTFTVAEPGEYTLYFEFIDQAGRPARTEIDFYATGSGWVQQASLTPSEIKLIVDRDIYRSGDTARILVQSPLPRGRYLLTVEREGILEERVISLEGSSEIIEIPIRDEYLPVFYVALSGYTERTVTENDYFEPDLGRPRDLFGLTSVRVATTPVELDVEVKSLKSNYRPGDEAEIEVSVSRKGTPVSGAEVTLLAVDRGVLDLINYHVPDPIEYFYNQDNFPLGVMGDDSRRLLLRPVTYEVSNLQGGDGSKMEERKDFNPLAVFEPSLRTGADGKLRLRAKLPDTLSTYRLTALALEGVKLGIDEDEFRVSNPVNVRTALPRLFRVRDTAAAGVILTNTTPDELTVKVSVESDILDIPGGKEKEVKLPPESATELPFLLEARRKGEGVIRFTLRSSVLNEVLEERVTVQQPIVTEAFTTIGIVSGGKPAAEQLVIPARSAEGWGGLSLAVDAGLYPYIEETVNRLQDIPYPSLNDRLYRITADLAADRSGSVSGIGLITARTEALYRELAANQFEDGGIGYRSPAEAYTRASWFLSVLAAHTATALEFENPVDTAALNRYLKTMLRDAAKHDSVSFLAAWTALALAENGDIGPNDLSWLKNSEDRLGIAGYNLLSRAYGALGLEDEAKTLYERSKKFITVGTRNIDVASTYETAGYFSSKSVELASLLENAALRNEEAELVLRIAGALDGSRNRRRFSSSFDDFWIVTGFLPLLSGEAEGSEVNLKVSLEGSPLLQRTFVPGAERSVREGFPLAVPPLSDFEKGVPLNLELEAGAAGGETGNLYYAATLRYALPVETALPRDEGIEVFSQIETLNGEILDAGALKPGETLRMRVTLSTLSRRSFLKLIVPIPSGSEIVDPSFATTGRYGDRGGTESESWTRETVYGDIAEFSAEGFVSFGPEAWEYWFYRPLQKVYDDAVSYTWEDFYSGQREVSFLFRTTTPGIYPTPPVSATLEFEPEVFGRGPGRLAVIQGE